MNEIDDQLEMLPETNPPKHRIGLLLFLTFVAITIFTVLIFTKRQVASVRTTIDTPIQENIQNSLSSSTPTPMPFAEMTIPHLRARDYTSQMSPLRKISENSEYTAFTTSYTSDGLKVNGYLTQPKGEMPRGGYPAIVFVHGYIPPASYRTTQNYVSYVDYLAKNGFVVFKIDLRGHDQSEGEPGGGYYSSDYIIDTLSATEALKTLPFVSKDKVGLWGHSMAGNVLMRSLSARPNIKAVAIWGGAVYTYDDMREYGIDDGSYRPPASNSPSRLKRQQLFDTYGQFQADHPFWKQVPATNYVDGITGAVGLFHAVNDAVVSIEYSRNLVKILDPAGVTHELYEYSSGGHNISGSVFSQAMRDTVNFYKKYLQ